MAGVSNGSLFHYFRTRQELDSALVAAALEDHQRALLVELSERPESAVIDVVGRHLRWVQDNVGMAGLLLQAPPDVLRAALTSGDLAANREFFTAIGHWLEGLGWLGRPALPVVIALWIGPAQEFSRGWLAGPRDTPLVDAATDLGRGAWRALEPLMGAPTSDGAVTEGQP